jgi:cytochrome c oxidase subunit 2
MLRTIKFLISAFFPGALLLAGDAFAGSDAVAGGRSEPWQMWFQPSASPVMERIVEFHNIMLAIEVSIVIFVLVLLCFIIVRFNAKSNPQPSKTTHNTLLEVLWTGVPLFILIVIAVPSLKLLYYTDKIQDAEMTRSKRSRRRKKTAACASALISASFRVGVSPRTASVKSRRRVCSPQ